MNMHTSYTHAIANKQWNQYQSIRRSISVSKLRRLVSCFTQIAAANPNWVSREEVAKEFQFNPEYAGLLLEKARQDGDSSPSIQLKPMQAQHRT